MNSRRILNMGTLCSLLLMGVLWVSLSLLVSAQAEELTITINQPELDANPYHRPYVAVWLETSKRQGVVTLALWREQSDWLKDLRQWWRKLGRAGYSNGVYRVEKYDSTAKISQSIDSGYQSTELDGSTGATRKPGVYTLNFDTEEISSELPAGEYYLNVESSREEGGRDFIRQKIQLGSGEPQQYDDSGSFEMGTVKILITP